MSPGQNLLQLYFDFVYNPAFDLTTAQTSPYRRLQRQCLDKLHLEDGASVVCIGLGTGNEVVGLLERNRHLDIVGVDTSPVALRRARKKAEKMGKSITTLTRDAQHLDLPDGCFDKALCLHVMDFVPDHRQATREVFRVLKPGGEFVITYPSGTGTRVGSEIARSIRNHLRQGRYGMAAREFLAVAGAGIVYLPLLLRPQPKRGFYTEASLKGMLAECGLKEFQIEEDRLYQDLIVYGRTP